MHAIEYKYAPVSYENVWKKVGDRDPELNLRNVNDFHLPAPRTEAFKKSTYYSMPSAWNNLAPEVKYQQNKITFKWALRAHLLADIQEEE
jgi:hypothetical protein